jgi:hypothetical protein
MVRGLAFESDRPFLSGYGALAVGGIERVQVDEYQDWGVPIGSPGTDRPFDASGTATIIAVQHSGGSSVTITGVAPGTARLRILEPGTQLLLDSIPIDVGAVAHERLAGWASGFLAPDAPTRALFAGADASLHFALVAADGADLWDDSVHIGVTAGRDARVHVPASGAVELVVSRAAGTSRFVFPVVSEIDDIVLGATWLLGPGTGAPPTDVAGGIDLHTDPSVSNDDPSVVCAVGMLGLASVEGVPFEVSVDDPVLVSLTASDTCVLLNVRDGLPAPATFATELHFSALGLRRRVQVRVHVTPADAASPLVSSATPWAPGAARTNTLLLGERASAER